MTYSWDQITTINSYSGVLFTLDLPHQEGQDWNDVLQNKQSMENEMTM